MASPAAVVRILMTQNMTVISGTFAAKGWRVKRRNSERTLWGLLVSGVGRTSSVAPNGAANGSW